MDDELIQLEVELKRLRPVPLSPALVRRIAVDLGEHPAGAPVPAYRAWSWFALPAAAAVTALLLHLAESRLAQDPARNAVRPGPAAPVVAGGEARYQPVAAENFLISASDEGLVTLDDGTPARRRRLHFVDTITWRDPRTNASVTWSLPREEVRVVPVIVQ